MANARTCLAITQQRSVPTLGLGDQLRYVYSQAFPWLLLTCSLLSSQHQDAVEMGPVLGACLPACGAKHVPGMKWKMGSENLIYCFLSSVGTPPSLTLGSMTGMILGHHQPLQASALQISDGDSLRRLWIVMEMWRTVVRTLAPLPAVLECPSRLGSPSSLLLSLLLAHSLRCSLHYSSRLFPW